MNLVWMAPARPVRMTVLKDFHNRWLADITLRWGKTPRWLDSRGAEESRYEHRSCCHRALPASSSSSSPSSVNVIECPGYSLLSAHLPLSNCRFNNCYKSVKTCERIIILSGSGNLCRTILKRIDPPGASVSSDCSASLALMHNYDKSSWTFIQ